MIIFKRFWIAAYISKVQLYSTDFRLTYLIFFHQVFILYQRDIIKLLLKQQAPVPDVYRGKYTYPNHSQSEEELGKMYADEVGRICKNISDKNGGVCAFIAESLQSCGGQIIPPDGYLKRVFE